VSEGEGDYEEAQIAQQATQQVLIPAVKDMGQALEKVNASVAQGAKKIATDVPALDNDLAQGFHGNLGDLGQTADTSAAGINDPASTSTPTQAPAPAAAPGDDFSTHQTGGQQPEGVSNCSTGGTDPVDVVSGQMITTTTDVELPGVLPLILRRAYASSYRHGQLFGPGWSSTLDQHLTIDNNGIHYLGDDAQILSYGIPTQPGQQLLPTAGARWPLTWDRALDAITVHDSATGLTRIFAPPPRDTVPDAQGRQTRHLARITDRNGNWLTIARDADGVPTEVSHIGGYRIAVDSSYQAAGFRIEGLRLLDGSSNGRGTALIGYRYDPAGRLVEIAESGGVPLVYEYDDADRITAWIDRSGYRYEYIYDAAGRVVRTGGQDGQLVAELAYDPQQRVTTVANSLGESTAYHYDQYQHVAKVVDPLGNATLTETDRYGRLLSFTDGVGNTTRYVLDEHGDPVEIERADGTRLTNRNTALRLVESTTAPDGAVWRYDYDERGNCTAVTDPLGAVTGFTYDDHGATTSRTDALGHVTRIECNRAGLPIAITSETGERAEVERDAFGRVVASRDPLGAVTRAAWTVGGRPIWREAADGTREEWGYDDRGELVEQRNALGHSVRYERGSFGLPTARTDPDGRRYEFRYDTQGRISAVTNPLGLSWRYQYDPAGRIAEETDFNGRTIAYQYDAAGRLHGRVTGDAPASSYRRDVLGRIVEARTGEESVRYEFDPCGRLALAASATSELAIERDRAGQIVSETVNGRTLTSAYDLRGSRVQRTTPGGAISRWTFDVYGQPTAFAGTGGSLAFEYDAAGHETTRFLGGKAALTQSFDPMGRLTAQAIWAYDPAGGSSSPGTEYQALQQRTYAYRHDGHLVAVGDSLAGNREYDLDPFGRVTSVTGANWSESYAYDAAGMIGSAGISGAAGMGIGGTGFHGANEHSDVLGPRTMDGTLIRQAARTTYEHDGQGRVVRTVQRTLSGQRRVWEFGWNDLNQLTSVTNPDAEHWEYSYDPIGRRSAKRQLAADGTLLRQIDFSWDGTRVAEQTASAPDRQPSTLSWDYRPGTLLPVAQTEKRFSDAVDQLEVDLRFYAIVTDLAGSPSELVDADGSIVWHRTASLWGLPLGNGASAGPSDADGSGVPDCPLRFPGQYHDDESGWHYNYFRYYDPAVGRYTSPDPLGLTPAPDDHGYVPNPCAATDPLGLAATPAAIMAPKPMLALDKSNREPPNIGLITSRDAVPGEEFNMVLSAPQPNTRPGGFGTFDDIPSQSYAREQLAIRSDWKPDVTKVQRYRIPDGDPIRIQESVVGPQPDPGLGRELPGGGTQLEILDPADRARLIPVGDPADLPCS
jgi:RHS repeat-associated protein